MLFDDAVVGLLNLRSKLELMLRLRRYETP